MSARARETSRPPRASNQRHDRSVTPAAREVSEWEERLVRLIWGQHQGASAPGLRGAPGARGAQPRHESEHGWTEFAEFYSKYRQFEQRAAAAPAPAPAALHPAARSAAAQLELPTRYDRRYRVNLACPGDGAALAQQLAASVTFRAMPSAEVEAVARAARQALAFFEDFQQKRRFKQLAKIQCTRRALPIAGYQPGLPTQGVPGFPHAGPLGTPSRTPCLGPLQIGKFP
jgi:hypothetical protein